ncbi:MAG: 50S ribosomal protein L28 [Deltaproteobacteria bacterium]|nr:50S ribosomal protein L28 [Deltaproteobacteria bacterium]
MANRCEICGKGHQVGNKVSHSNIKTKRLQMPNIQSLHAVVDGVHRRVRACTRCIRSGKVVKA